MSEIKPKITYGEPVCSGEECRFFVDFRNEEGGFRDFAMCSYCASPTISHKRTEKGWTCIVGIRLQRDEARRLFCKLSAEYMQMELLWW
jgi:hypothetical protein